VTQCGHTHAVLLSGGGVLPLGTHGIHPDPQFRRRMESCIYPRAGQKEQGGEISPFKSFMTMLAGAIAAATSPSGYSHRHWRPALSSGCGSPASSAWRSSSPRRCSLSLPRSRSRRPLFRRPYVLPARRTELEDAGGSSPSWPERRQYRPGRWSIEYHRHGAGIEFAIHRYLTAAALTVAVWMVVIGGLHKIAAWAEKLVL